MMNEVPTQCVTCRFFHPLREKETWAVDTIGGGLYWTDKGYTKETPMHGQCRKHPPQIYTDSENDTLFIWPIVEDTAWCGAWEEASPQEIAHRKLAE